MGETINDLLNELIVLASDERSSLNENICNLVNSNKPSSLMLNMSEIVKFCSEEVIDLMFNAPDKFHELLAKVVDEIGPSLMMADNDIDAIVQDIIDGVIRVRYYNYPFDDMVRIAELNNDKLDKLIVCKVSVKSITKRKPYPVLFCTTCLNCGEMYVGRVPPKVCKVCKDKNNFDKKIMKAIDCVKILFGDPPEETGGLPVEMVGEAKGDIVDEIYSSNVPIGSKAILYGILRGVRKKKGSREDYLYMIDVCNLEFLDVYQDDEEDVEESEILAFAKEHDVLEVFKKCVAPSIYGYDIIKEAIVLQLFGGTTIKEIGKRGNIHILIVGDPSVGKTNLLENVHRIAPNSRLISCIAASGKGLTASISRDEMMGTMIKIGPILMSHKGFALLDEVDKIDKEDMKYLSDVLEYQRFNLNKAGISIDVPVEASVLAVANPKYGRFDEYTPVIDNINLRPEILSRFDLIFAIKDRIEDDEEYVKYMSKIYYGEFRRSKKFKESFLKKYVVYARNNIRPLLDKEAMDLINDYFLSLRKRIASTGVFTIDRRRREVIIRLAEASAKVRLSKVANAEDAARAIKIVNYFLKTIGIDYDPETGQSIIDIDVINSGISKRKRDRMVMAEKVLKSLEDKEGFIDVEEALEELANTLNCERMDAESLINKLKSNGILFEPVRGKLKFV